MESKTGDLLTLFTVIATTSLSAPADVYEAMKVTLKGPDCVKSGLNVSEPAPLPESTKVLLVGAFRLVKIILSASKSVACTRNCMLCPSLTDLGPIESKTGA